MRRMQNLLEVKNLSVSFFTHVGEVRAIRGIDFHVEAGESLGIVGESGSGKSVTMLSLMRLLPENGRIVAGDIFFGGRNLASFSEKQMEKVRGNEIGMIFQDPMTSLNPVFTVGNQLIETLKKHKRMSEREAYEKSLSLLAMVMIPDPERRIGQYPHEFSGGMRQRVMIAMALCCDPALLIADEPTTALDVTIQAQILDLMRDLNRKIRTSIILITHDLGVVAGICDRVVVMYAGSIVESGPVRDIFYRPRHPYTIGLLRSVPNPKRMIRERLIPIDGQPPDLLKPPPGCAFAPRCGHAMKVCLQRRPPMFATEDASEDCAKHRAACFLNHPRLPAATGGGLPWRSSK